MVSVLLPTYFPPFSAHPSSAGLPTGVLHGNVSEYALIPGKCTHILLGCIGNRLCTLATLEPVGMSVLGTVPPLSRTLYPVCLRICESPRLDTLWIRLDDGPVNGVKSGLERLRIGIVYILRLDTRSNG